MSRRYLFRHVWSLPVPPEDVFGILADVAGYPAWWRQVRAVARVDDDSAHVVVRSVLPYTLDLTLTRVIEDSAAGVLEARLGGQLEGWSRWTLGVAGSGTSMLYEQDVTVQGRRMTAASRLAPRLLVANHEWMMRGGRVGLLSHARGQAGSTAR